MFQNRVDAGRQLTRRLARQAGPDVVALGIPRGGVVVADVVAATLRLPLDVVVVRKLGAPGRPELAVGAVGEGGIRVLDAGILRDLRVSAEHLDRVARSETAVVAGRLARLRGGRPPVELTDRTALVIDDGIATGSTARAACAVARARGARRVVLAAPVAPGRLTVPEADVVICVLRPARFLAVGEHYLDFSPTSEEEVERLLAAAALRAEAPPEPAT